MKYPPFNEKELMIKEIIPGMFGDLPVFNFPITPRENSVAVHSHQTPCWILTDVESKPFCPSVIPDHGARGFVFEGREYPREQYGGKDMFGVKWEYIEIAHGSMVKPGSPLLEDVNDWKDVLKFPDIDSWDWDESEKLNREYLSSDRCSAMTLLNGCWFERLISFMDFEGAALAVIDEDQRDALKDLLHATTSLYMRIVDKAVKHYQIDGFCIHDDWGSQRAPFFSEDVAREIFLPEMKRFVSHAHSYGKYVDLHSCGHIEDRCGVFVDAGFDSWTPMSMNNTGELYRKYGDRIVIGVVPDTVFDPRTASEEEQRSAARAFVEKYTEPGKLCSYSTFYAPEGMLTPAFREELYRTSRIRYSRQSR